MWIGLEPGLPLPNGVDQVSCRDLYHLIRLLPSRLSAPRRISVFGRLVSRFSFPRQFHWDVDSRPTSAQPGTIGDTETEEVAWCTKSGRGTRTIPDGTLKGVHFVKTPHYVQVTGVGDFTKMNIRRGDAGGELDNRGADGMDNDKF